MLKKSLKLAMLGLTGAFLYGLIWTGTLEMYIHPRFSTMILVASVGLFLVGISFIRADDRLAHEHESVPWWGFLILAIPLVLGWLVQPRPLGASAMQNRSVDVTDLQSISAGSGEVQQIAMDPLDRNVLDWIKAFQRDPVLSNFEGEPVQLKGFVFKDERFAEDQFMISRFLLSCCTADGSPVGLLVETDSAPDWEPDMWVEIEGEIVIREFEGVDIPMIAVSSITEVDVPAQPYLYP